MTPSHDFPRLTEHNHRSTSPPASDYNCVAWAANDTEHWWEPGLHWPVSAPPNEFGIGVLEAAFSALGFEDCADGSPEPGFEKVAIYGNTAYYTHAARQLPNGTWTSKLGRMEDIEHNTPEVIAGGIYGEVVQYMKRRAQRDL